MESVVISSVMRAEDQEHVSDGFVSYFGVDIESTQASEMLHVVEFWIPDTYAVMFDRLVTDESEVEVLYTEKSMEEFSIHGVRNVWTFVFAYAVGLQA